MEQWWCGLCLAIGQSRFWCHGDFATTCSCQCRHHQSFLSSQDGEQSRGRGRLERAAALARRRRKEPTATRGRPHMECARYHWTLFSLGPISVWRYFLKANNSPSELCIKVLTTDQCFIPNNHQEWRPTTN